MLKVSGVWVSPIEIERVLIEHPAVQEAAVVFRKDEDDLPKPLACISIEGASRSIGDLGFGAGFSERGSKINELLKFAAQWANRLSLASWTSGRI